MLGGLLQRHVNDCRLAAPLIEPLDQQPPFVTPADRLDPQVQVGAVEAGGDDILGAMANLSCMSVMTCGVAVAVSSSA